MLVSHIADLDRKIGSSQFNLDQWLPYNELTTDVLVGWVKESIGPEQVLAYERNL